MHRQFIYFLVFVLFGTSCTAFKSNFKAKEEIPINRNDVNDLNVKDKVFVKLKKGKSLRGKVTDINDEFFVVRINKNQNQTIYFPQVKSIKYKANVPVTVLKIMGGVISVILIVTVLTFDCSSCTIGI